MASTSEYKCQWCTKKFQLMISLKQHIQCKHPDKSTSTLSVPPTIINLSKTSNHPQPSNHSTILSPEPDLKIASHEDTSVVETSQLIEIEEIKIFKNTTQLDPSKSYMYQDELLTSLGYRYHTLMRVMQCSICSSGIYPENVDSHYQSHDITISDLNSVKTALAKFTLDSPQVVNGRLPKSTGPPVEGLKTLEGFKCALCDHAAPAFKSVTNRFSKDHPHSHLATKDKANPATLQNFWNHKNRAFFAVNPSAAPLSSTLTPFDVYLQKNPVQLTTTYTLPEDEVRNFHPLIGKTGWHDHLRPYMGSSHDIEALVDIAVFPKKDEALLNRIHPYVIAYVTTVGKMGKDACLKIMKMLHQYPLVHGENHPWRVFPEDSDTLTRYAGELTRFLAGIYRSLTSESPYKFPLSESQLQDFDKFIELLKKSESSDNMIPVLHKVVYSLIGKPAPGSDQNQWKCVMACWLAVSSLKKDGRFQDAGDYTQVLAKWTYLQRCFHFYEATLHVTEHDNGLIGAIIHQCSSYMTEESFSPYITIRDHQHLASSISFNEAMDPTVVWNPDMSLLDCLGFTLSIAGFRGGIQEMLASLRRRIEALCGSIPTNVSKDLTEDFSDRSIGLSWMHPTNFTGGAPLPLLKHLLEIAENCPAEVDSFGILHWNPANVAYYRRLFDQINLELSILCFILPAPSPRGTEFMDTRIRNDQISRNVYKSFGTWFIYRVVKMTNIMGSLAWIPTLLPSVLSELLDRYLLLIRPVEIIFTEILSGPASRALYEHIWAAGLPSGFLGI
ncbi:hypothetical protein NLI96_g11455 [Meripilus lineatus]|uniref:C2H2-type domain-containing protein n=1 Tax=Meripilus lineatus TaxID=2056292 RepID=A0AAD5URT6_9APHY|nr:hypothetical protein NLI96_g11455 [Physisporinus lineatus]